MAQLVTKGIFLKNCSCTCTSLLNPVEKSAKRQAPGLVNFVYLPMLTTPAYPCACSIHATCGPPFGSCLHFSIPCDIRVRAHLDAHDVPEVAVAAVEDGGEDEELASVGVGVVERRDGVDPSPGQLGRLPVFLEHSKRAYRPAECFAF